jgi:PQ loop repeat
MLIIYRAYRYYQFVVYFTLGLFVVHVFLPPISSSAAYISFLGGAGLTIEATLPLPQIFKNHQARSCKGFRLSVIANWLVGDMMKMSYFFFSSEVIPWSFKLCGIFQMACDLYLGLQFYMYGDGSGVGRIPDLGIQMSETKGRVR